ncbi:MAG TPA: ABC transporter ATP-binding protein [Streptosporangiaceae bacterium]|jgi:peptide/nickel transport system ATP-binding protein
MATAPARPGTTLRAEAIEVRYGEVTALHGVSLELRAGTRGLALVGESGSGKTTVARALLGLIRPSSGRVEFSGTDIHHLSRDLRRRYRREVQPVFQEAHDALDPRMSVRSAIAEALRLSGDLPRSAVAERCDEALRSVELDPDLLRRKPHQISGGQRQRVVIARALAIDPELLILDEPTSALDVTVQAKILNLLAGLQASRQLSYLLITHNLGIVERLCDDIHVLFGGHTVEIGSSAAVLARPAHPYTVALRAAVPRFGKPPDPPPRPVSSRAADAGCVYQHRCPLVVDHCRRVPPPLLPRPGGRLAACHRVDDVLAGEAASAQTKGPANP